MKHTVQQVERNNKDKREDTHTAFKAFSDGRLVEMLYDPNRVPPTHFALYDPATTGSQPQIDLVDSVSTAQGTVHPLKAGKIMQTKTILLPSKVVDSGPLGALVSDIRDFIRKYVVVSERFTWICANYVLFTWVFDRFSVVPYLRVLGGPGSGKSRCLQVVGSICYKSITTMGAATMSPIFRLLDQFHGTLVLDESDFGRSDEAHLIIRMLNTGFQRGFPLLRSEGRSFVPTSFDVYGPKIIASCRAFPDDALESRCITEKMQGRLTRKVPLILPDGFWKEALQLRNRLVDFRLRHYSRIRPLQEMEDRLTALKIRPRILQIGFPLLCVAEDDAFRNELIESLKEQEEELAATQFETSKGRIAKVILDSATTEIPVKEITEKVNESIDTERYKLSPERVGKIIRELGLTTKRKSSGSVVDLTSQDSRNVCQSLRDELGYNHDAS